MPSTNDIIAYSSPVISGIHRMFTVRRPVYTRVFSSVICHKFVIDAIAYRGSRSISKTLSHEHESC